MGWCSERQSGLEGEMRNSLVVQWLGLCAFTAEGLGSIPGQGTKIPQATWHSQRIKKKNRRYVQQLKLWTLRPLTVLYKRKRVQGGGPENLGLRAKQRKTSLEAKKHCPEK